MSCEYSKKKYSQKNPLVPHWFVQWRLRRFSRFSILIDLIILSLVNIIVPIVHVSFLSLSFSLLVSRLSLNLMSKFFSNCLSCNKNSSITSDNSTRKLNNVTVKLPRADRENQQAKLNMSKSYWKSYWSDLF